MRNCLDQLGLWACLWDIVLIVNGCEKACLSWEAPFPSQGILNSMTERTKVAEI